MATAGAVVVTVSCVIRGYSLHQVQIVLSGTVQEVHIAITQYPGVPPLPKLEVLPNFRVGQYIDFFACQGKIAASL